MIPFIEANLRTLTGKQGRAVAGISMGGFGALHYAQRHPGLFSQVATFSGANELSRNHAVTRAAVVATLTNIGAPLCGSSSGPSCALDFGPSVSSDALFGTPYPFFDADWRWNAADPIAHMAALKGMGIAVYTGNGNGNPSDGEFWVQSAAQHTKERLDALGFPHHYVNYGNGAGWGANCNGGHNSGCWSQDLVDWVPRLEAAFAAAPAPEPPPHRRHPSHPTQRKKGPTHELIPGHRAGTHHVLPALIRRRSGDLLRRPRHHGLAARGGPGERGCPGDGGPEQRLRPRGRELHLREQRPPPRRAERLA